MTRKSAYSLTGTVEKIEDGKITLNTVTFDGKLDSLGPDYKCIIPGSHQIAKLRLQEGNVVNLKAIFEALDLGNKTVKFEKVINAEKVPDGSFTVDVPPFYNTDFSKNDLLEIPDLSVEDILGKDHPHLENITKTLSKGYTYRKNFLKSMNIVAEVNRLPTDFAYNVLKSTRVGATTNIGISALVLGLKIVVIVPNNDVMDAVEKTYKEYVRLTGDHAKTFRKIQSNAKVCQRVMAKMKKNPATEKLPYLMKGNCVKCGADSVVDEKVAKVIKTDNKIDLKWFGRGGEIKEIKLHPELPEGDGDQCYQKAMVDELLCLEKEGFKLGYDLTVITLDKALALMKSESKTAELLLEVITNADLLLFDEFGQYTSKQPQGVKVWEKRELIDTTAKKKGKKKVKKGKRRKKEPEPTPAVEITKIREKVKEIEEAVEGIKGFKYEIIRPIFTEFLDKAEKIIKVQGTFRRIRNPLLSADYGDRRYYDLTRNEAEEKPGKKIPPGTKMSEILEYFFKNNYSKLENGIDYQNEDEIEFLISLITTLLSEDIVFHYSKVTTWEKNEKTKDHERFKIEMVKLLPGDDVLVENINTLIGRNQRVIFTDATTPPFRFSRLNRDVKNIMFGDPLGTNKTLQVIYDDTLHKFDSTRWHKGGHRSKSRYKKQIIDKLMLIIKKLGKENVKIWAPNKNIARDIVKLLNLKIEKLACTPDNTAADSRVVVDWMRSSGARGVESDRRMHIIVGNPDVPRSAYGYLAFMYPDLFDAIPDHEIERIAFFYMTTVDKVREIIGTFHNPEYIGNIEYRKETTNEIEAELISIISDQLRSFFVGSDGWQAGSRAKDPTATDHSVLYFLAWDKQAAYNTVQWGYDLQMLASRKTMKDQSTIIPPPMITTGGVVDAGNWRAGKERDPSLLLSSNFSELPSAISYMLAFAEKSVTSEEIWPNISPNLHVGYDSENHCNGFFVALNRCLKSDSIQVTETAPGEFEYNFGYSTGINIPDPDMKLIRKVLHTSFRSKKEEVLVGDITRNNRSKKKIKSKKGKKNANKIETEKVKEAFKLINENKLLEGSTWKVEQYEIKKGINKGIHLKIVKNQNAIG